MDGAVWQTDCDGVLRPADMATLDALMAREWGFESNPRWAPTRHPSFAKPALARMISSASPSWARACTTDWAMLGAYEFDGTNFELPLDPLTGGPTPVSASNLQTGGTLDTSWLS